MSRSRPFRLRRRHFNDKPITAVSGDNPLPRPWPETVQVGRAAPNLQLIADPIANRHDVTRHRSSVAATFVPSDTTRAHFEHSRAVFLRMGVPAALHANGLALFGHEATAEGRDPKSESQRALTTLGVSHLVAPTHQARVKIERRFGTLQGRVAMLPGPQKVPSLAHIQVVLQAEIDHRNRTVCRTTGMTPNNLRDRAVQDEMTVMQPVPSTALPELHLSLHDRRRRNTDNQVDFLRAAVGPSPQPFARP